MNNLGFLKILLPVFIIVAILPFFIVFLSKPINVRFNSQASKQPNLRIWFEPKEIESKVGVPVTIRVVSEFESDASDILSKLEFGILSDSKSVLVNPITVSFKKPFSGKTTIGEITVTGRSEGEAHISLIEESIRTNFDKDSVKIISTPAFVKFVE